MRLKDKVAIITGAGSGIGQATAVLFSKEGAYVVIADIDKEKGTITLDLIKNQNGDAIFVETNVSNAESVRKMVNAALDNYGKIDILVNNAGIFFDAKVIDMTEDEWNRIMDINLKSVFLCCKYCIPEMIKNKSGSIVNVSSESGIIGEKDLSAYCVSKSGIIALTKCIAIEYAEYNIRANSVCPGTIETALVKDFIRKAADPAKALHNFQCVRPANRLGHPNEIAAGILYLASDESPYATGSILSIDGGFTAQ